MSSSGQKKLSDLPGNLLSRNPSSQFILRIISLFIVLLWITCSLPTTPVRADGGGPQPTNTVLPGVQIAPTSLPNGQLTPTSAPGDQTVPSLLTSTPEVKSFEIVIDSNQNATVQPITPENQAVLARSEAIEAQANTVAQEEEFDSPLWVFGFFTLIILILILNSVSRGMRNRA